MKKGETQNKQLEMDDAISATTDELVNSTDVRGNMFWVDDGGEILPFDEEEQDQSYYIQQFINNAVSDNRLDLIDRWNTVKDIINPPIYDRSKIHNDTFTERQMQGATIENFFAKNMVAMEFGEDFVERLFTIAEKAELSDTGRALELLESSRNSVDEITGWYEGFDGGKFAKEYRLASKERLTDMLAAVAEVAQTGRYEADLGVVGGKVSYESVGEVLDAFELEEKSLRQIVDVVGDKNTEVKIEVEPDEYDIRKMYRFSSEEHGEALLYVRKEGSMTFDPYFEYGKKVRSGWKNEGIEASISWIVNPVDPFSLKMGKDSNGVSPIRLDREGRVAGEAPNSEERSPVRDEGMVSVDISSVLGDPDSPAVKIGKVVSAGKKIRGGSDLHHNANFFDQELYGKSETFYALAEYVDDMAKNMVVMSAKKKAEKKLGKGVVEKTRRAA